MGNESTTWHEIWTLI